MTECDLSSKQRSGSPRKKETCQLLAPALRKLGYEVTITPINQLAPTLLSKSQERIFDGV
jgi:hypothetical protein